MKIVKKGNKVKVEYEGTFDDGTVFDTNKKQSEPLEFEAGSGELIKGFDEAVLGMQEGEEKKITLQPGDAYGNYNTELVRELPKDCFPTDQELKPGMVFMIKMQNGQQVPFRITKISDETITVDLNPPLAGKKLNFLIKIIEIVE
ncbi:MAG: peptidylprolyl isomerase [Candidatus Thermoplasmatota archaeon]|nr:peptidylprolyl isomerase [Candidatus Thermoplasmatota archaeon]MBU1940365.1 peptidylprolyl isomerase [Candidatus Thermoplasmatota archaeon]